MACIVEVVNLTSEYLNHKTQLNSSPLLGTAYGFSLPKSMPLTTAVERAQIIVVGQIADYAADPEPPKNVQPTFNDPTALLSNAIVQPAGKYNILVSQTLKGQIEPTLRLKLPSLVSIYYDTDQLHARKGDTVLLMLDKSPQGNWVPVDNTLPLIRLANGDQTLTVDRTSGDIHSQVINLMLASLTDLVARGANTYLLRDIVSSTAVQAMKKYANDPDLRVRDHVLCFLAINQDVSTIPLIAQLEVEVKRTGHGSARSVGTLDNFKTPQAIPYLNSLLFESAYFSRLNASDALRNIADRTSIPFLMLALRDPDPQHVIAYNAYWTLHRLIPNLGKVKSLPYFQVQPEVESQPIYDWWRSELEGKHQKQSQIARGLPEIGKSTSSDVSTITLLFEPSTTTRREAMSLLLKTATRDTIPYLILSLQDPDPEVSYSAYVILSRFIPNLRSIKDNATFTNSRKVATQPVYDWWEDELKAGHN